MIFKKHVLFTIMTNLQDEEKEPAKMIPEKDSPEIPEAQVPGPRAQIIPAQIVLTEGPPAPVMRPQGQQVQLLQMRQQQHVKPQQAQRQQEELKQKPDVQIHQKQLDQIQVQEPVVIDERQELHRAMDDVVRACERFSLLVVSTREFI